MSSPLIERLILQNGYSLLDGSSLKTFLEGEGDRVLFLTGDPARNLESDDMAVILPELIKASPAHIEPAVVDRSIERLVRERFDVWPLPSLIFIRDGKKKGAIAKMRGWDEFLGEIGHIFPHFLKQTAH